MPSISSAEMAQMRLDLADTMLPSLCNILSVTRTSNGAGGFTETWGTATANVACRISSVSGREQIMAEGVRPYTRLMLTVPYDTVISSANRVEVGTITYAVVSADSGKSWDVCRRCEVEKL